MKDADLGRKRASEQVDPLGGVAPIAPLPSAKNLLALPPLVVPSSPSSKQDPKRSRTSGDRNNGKKGAVLDKQSDAKSATSREEDCRDNKYIMLELSWSGQSRDNSRAS